MSDDDNSELVLQAMLATHEQLLETLRQRRLSLLRIASFNIVFLSILVGFGGVIIQVESSIGLVIVFIPVVFVLAVIVISVIQYRSFKEHWGFNPGREVATELSNNSKQDTIEDLAEIYQISAKENRESINQINKWIFRMIMLMSGSFGALLTMILYFR